MTRSGASTRPGSCDRLDAAAAFWRAYLAAMVRHDWSFLSAGDESAAVWVPPGERELTTDQEHELEALLRELLGDAQAAGRPRCVRAPRRRPSPPRAAPPGQPV